MTGKEHGEVAPDAQEQSSTSLHPRGGRSPEDTMLLVDIAQAILARSADPQWVVAFDSTWCRMNRRDAALPEQGWKLHVSATLLSAPIVLSRVAEILVAERCPFKFSRDLGQLRTLLSSWTDRGSGGKFITAYPLDVPEFRRLAQRLDAATDGLSGPAILSDRPVRPGSLVHYRFGVFKPRKAFTNEGSYARMLTAPDGRLMEDRRTAWFSPPSWAPLPVPGTEGAGAAVGSAKKVILGERFTVTAAIRHSYRGGVFRAVDRDTGAEVVVKQARPHVMPALDGTDARDRLRHEAEMLDRLAPLGLAPRPIALFTQQDSVFLAEEMMPGVPLGKWAGERAVGEWRGQGPPPAEAVRMATSLVRRLAAVHRQGLVLRDFTPNNIMVAPDGQLHLIDLEHAVPIGTRVWKVYTDGYAPREVVDASAFGPAPDQTADLFSLGTTILHMASGRRPTFAADNYVRRPTGQRLAGFVHRLGRRLPSIRVLAPLISGLTHDRPEERWSLNRAESFLIRLVGEPLPETPDDHGGVLPDAVIDRLLIDGFEHVVQTMTTQADTLWPTDSAVTTDPCNVQHGAAGVLGVLVRAAQVLDDRQLYDAAVGAAQWIGERRYDVPRFLPGLYFGRAGTAWSMYDAGRLTGDREATQRALQLAARLPVSWPNPDVCHGSAGAGLTYLHLWHATGDPEMERRAVQTADDLVRTAHETDGRLLWSTAADFDSSFAGDEYYGFAHGVAGIGAFLLYAAVATGRDEYLETARYAGTTLERAALVDGDAAWWPAKAESGADTPRLLHWCSGSAGVGTFLIRLWSITGEPRFRAMAEAAAAAIHRDQWYSSTSTCHGVPGHGEFLLDLADFTGDQRYRGWAGELAATIHTMHAIRAGRTLIPDESGADFTVGYHSGMSGVLGFLLRLRHGGPRWWMPDEVLPVSPPTPAATAVSKA